MAKTRVLLICSIWKDYEQPEYHYTKDFHWKCKVLPRVGEYIQLSWEEEEDELYAALVRVDTITHPTTESVKKQDGKWANAIVMECTEVCGDCYSADHFSHSCTLPVVAKK